MWTNMECKCGMHGSNLFIALFPSFYLSHSTCYGFRSTASNHRTHTHFLLYISIKIIFETQRMAKEQHMHSCRDFINWYCNHKQELWKFFWSKKGSVVCISIKFFNICYVRISSRHSPHSTRNKVRTLPFFKTLLNRNISKWFSGKCKTISRICTVQNNGDAEWIKMHTSSTIFEQNRHETCDLGMITSQSCWFVKHWLSTSKIYIKWINFGMYAIYG